MAMTKYVTRIYYNNQWQEVNESNLALMLNMPIHEATDMLSRMVDGEKGKLNGYNFQKIGSYKELTFLEEQQLKQKRQYEDNTLQMLKDKGSDKYEELKAKIKAEREAEDKELQFNAEQQKAITENFFGSETNVKSSSDLIAERLEQLQNEINELKNPQQAEPQQDAQQEDANNEDLTAEQQFTLSQVEQELNFKDAINKAIDATLAELGIIQSGDGE